TSLRADAGKGPGGCGLGEKPAVPDGLSERGRDVIAAWIRAQDALDRKRNHFLKEFRARNGFDRRSYAPETLAEYEAGLQAVNREEDEGLCRAAEALIASGF